TLTRLNLIAAHRRQECKTGVRSFGQLGQFVLTIVLGRERSPGPGEMVELGQSGEGIAQRERLSCLTIDPGQDKQAVDLNGLHSWVVEEVAKEVSKIQEHAAAGAARKAGDHVHTWSIGPHTQAALLDRGRQGLGIRQSSEFATQAPANRVIMV